MKPVVVPIDKDTGRVTLTKEELEKILSDVYQEGCSDGGKTPITYPVWPSYPTIPNYPYTSYEPTMTYTNNSVNGK